MQVFSKECNELEELVSFFKSINDSPQQVVQIFSTKSEAINKKIIAAFKQYLPQSKLMGSTAEEVILENKVENQRINAVALNFAKSTFKLIRTEKDSFSNGNLINREIDSDTKAIIVFSDDKYNNGDNLVQELNKNESENIILAGGQAGFGDNNDQGYIFDKRGIIKNGSLALILNGKELKVNWNYSMGWDSISREMEITKAENQIVYELDGRNIFQVYSEFLGEDIKQKLPSPAVTRFPLVYKYGFKNARSAINKVGEGIKFSGDLKEGDIVQIAYGSLNKILVNSDRLHSKLDFKPEISLVYSCSSREKYLASFDSSVSDEIKVIPSPKIGFLTNGEYGTINNNFEHLNITTTVLYLSENSNESKEKFELDIKKPELKVDHLFHLSKKVVSDLEMINDKMRRANKLTVNHKVEDTAANLFKILFDDYNYTGGIVIKESDNFSKIYLDDNLGSEAYDLFESFWDEAPAEIKIKENVLGYKKAFLVPLSKEVEALLIILSNEIDLYDLKKNRLFIDQISNYIKKSILYESLERNLASLSTLEKTSDFLYSTLDLELLYDRILDIIVATMGMSAAIIFKKENDKLIALNSINVEEKSELFYYLKGHYSDIAASDKVLIENEIEFFGKTNTLIAIPINLNDYQGVLYALQSKYTQLINENQRKFIRTLANQIKVSIRNALNHKKVKKLSVTDGLTKLYNHSYFHEKLQNKRGEEYSVAILDIDNFKEFNDKYGHQAGDEILRKLSECLKNELRDDDIVARYGGEEFIIYFNITDKDLLSKILTRLSQTIRSLSVIFEEKILKITVSIGAAINKNGKLSAKRLIKQADTALYVAKGAGKDDFKFYNNVNK